MLRERNQTFKLMFIGLDLALTFIAFACATVIHFHFMNPHLCHPDYVRPDSGGFLAPAVLFSGVPDNLICYPVYAFLGIFFTISQVAVFIATDLYHPRRGLNWFREAYGIARGVGLNVLIVLAFLFFYRGTFYSRLVLTYSVSLTICFVVIGHFGFRGILAALRSRGFNTRSVLILGTGPNASRVMQTLLRHRIFGYRILGFVGPKSLALPEVKPYVLGSMREVKRIAQKKMPDLIVYAMPHKKATLQDVVEFCDNEGIDCRIVPDMVEMLTAHARIEDMDGMPLLTIRDIPLKNGYNRFVKRSFDLLFSVAFVLFASPIYIAIAALIKFTSPGPVLFSQDRIGLDRRPFKVYKFRTMVVQSRATSDTTWGGKADDRVTSIGRFLRKTSLDELPQFFNVIKGDMSVVGPRPERPHFVAHFKSRYANYMRRHEAKAGITGWAQIQGWRGDTSIEKRVEADIYYIENWSVWLDVLIVLRTAPAVILNPGE